MTAVVAAPIARTEARSRVHEIWRIVRLHAINPSVFFGIPWIILGSAWAVMMIVGLIITGAGGPAEDMAKGMRYSWAVLSPQWYLVVVGVQAIGLTISFALGFGTTRRDIWLGTSAPLFSPSLREMSVKSSKLTRMLSGVSGMIRIFTTT